MGCCGPGWPTAANTFPATALLELLQDTEVSKPALLDVIAEDADLGRIALADSADYIGQALTDELLIRIDTLPGASRHRPRDRALARRFDVRPAPVAHAAGAARA